MHAAPTNSPYKVGESVEYFSTGKKSWQPARIVSFGIDANGNMVLVNLNCKSGAKLESVRKLPAKGGSKSADKTSRGVADAPDAAVGASEARRAKGASLTEAKPIAVGEAVRFFSKPDKRWVKAKVVSANLAADRSVTSYNLDVKDKVDPWRVERDAPPKATAKASDAAPVPREGMPAVDFTAGETIEYWSKQQDKWFLAVVQSKSLDKTGVASYNLKCESFNVEGAYANRLRKRLALPAPQLLPRALAGDGAGKAVAMSSVGAVGFVRPGRR